jgi:hypothetical protein
VPGSVAAGDFTSYDDTAESKNGPRVGPNNSEIGYTQSGESASYTLTAAKAGKYSVVYWLAGDAPANTQATLYLVKGSNCAAKQQLALLDVPDFDTGSYSEYKAYPAAAPVKLAKGVQEVTLCLEDVAYLNVQKIVFKAV